MTCIRGEIVALALLLLAGCATSPAVRHGGSCTVVGRGRELRQLRALHDRFANVLVLAGDAVLSCSCGQRGLGGATQARRMGGATQARRMGGATQARRFGGDTQARRFGGDTQGRRMGGATEARRFGGDTQGRRMGGATQARRFGGDTQARRMGGGTSRISCRQASRCGGFEVVGLHHPQYFDGESIKEAPSGCIPCNR